MIPSIYVHLSGADVRKKRLIKAGLISGGDGRKRSCTCSMTFVRTRNAIDDIISRQMGSYFRNR